VDRPAASLSQGGAAAGPLGLGEAVLLTIVAKSSVTLPLRLKIAPPNPSPLVPEIPESPLPLLAPIAVLLRARAVGNGDDAGVVEEGAAHAAATAAVK
jgi:hypothetical protein